MRMVHRLFVPLSLLAILASSKAVGQQSDSSAAPQVSDTTTQKDQIEAGAADATITESTNPIEEITVRGQQTLGSLRFLLREAEDDMYAMFNDLNSDDDFDITCDKVRRTGSYILDRVCEPRFLKRERQANTTLVMSQLQSANRNIANSGNGLDFGAIGDYWQQESELRALLSHRFEDMGEEMLRIAAENPDFHNALMQMSVYRQSFEAMRAERFENEKTSD